MNNIDEKILQAVKEAGIDGKLSCGQARALAEKLQVPVKIVGEAADQLKIKIKDCQLGCF